jgi:epidermal growth factor receptor substrate 15
MRRRVFSASSCASGSQSAVPQSSWLSRGVPVDRPQQQRHTIGDEDMAGYGSERQSERVSSSAHRLGVATTMTMTTQYVRNLIQQPNTHTTTQPARPHRRPTVSQSASQSVNQSVSQSISLSASKPVGQSASRSVGQSSQSVSQSVGQSVSQSVSQPASQPAGRPVSHSAVN